MPKQAPMSDAMRHVLEEMAQGKRLVWLSSTNRMNLLPPAGYLGSIETVSRGTVLALAKRGLITYKDNPPLRIAYGLTDQGRAIAKERIDA